MDEDWGPNADDFIGQFSAPLESIMPGGLFDCVVGVCVCVCLHMCKCSAVHVCMCDGMIVLKWAIHRPRRPLF